MDPVVDAHQHVWDLTVAEYPWLSPDYGVLYRTYGADELMPQLGRAGVDKTVLVQAADNRDGTEHMLSVAARFDYVAGVVAWVPLNRPDKLEKELERLSANPIVKGVRHLIHVEPDPDWLLRPAVVSALTLLAQQGLTLDIPAVLPRHLEHVPILADRVPGLRIVIDHLAKPPIKDRGWEPWATLLRRAADAPTVHAKVSGLNTAAALDGWTADDLRPYVDHAVDCFGPTRLMFGSDWPVLLLAGDYQRVWDETGRVLAGLEEADRRAIYGGTANDFYRLGL